VCLPDAMNIIFALTERAVFQCWRAKYFCCPYDVSLSTVSVSDVILIYIDQSAMHV